MRLIAKTDGCRDLSQARIRLPHQRRSAGEPPFANISADRLAESGAEAAREVSSADADLAGKDSERKFRRRLRLDSIDRGGEPARMTRPDKGIDAHQAR